MQMGSVFFCVYFFSILCALRIAKNISPALIVCALAVVVYGVGLLTIFLRDEDINFFMFTSTYACFVLNTLMLFGAVYKSISLKMMLYLLDTPNGEASYDDIYKNYIQNQSYLNRFDILLEKNVIQSTGDGAFVLTKKGLSWARKLWIIQQLFSIRSSG